MVVVTGLLLVVVGGGGGRARCCRLWLWFACGGGQGWREASNTGLALICLSYTATFEALCRANKIYATYSYLVLLLYRSYLLLGLRVLFLLLPLFLIN